MWKFYMIAILWGVCQASKLDSKKTKEIDVAAKADLTLVVDKEMNISTERIRELVQTCNTSVNNAIAYCQANCQSSGGGGAVNGFDAILLKLDNGFKSIEGGIKAKGDAIKNDFNKFKSQLETLSKQSTWKNLGTSVLDKLKSGTTKALDGLKTATSTIGNKAKEWSSKVGDWFKDTFKLGRRKRAAALTCDLCNTMSSSTGEEVLTAVCGSDVTAEIALLSESLDKMLALMETIASEEALVTQINTDADNTKYVPGPDGFQVTSPITSVIYSVNGTSSTAPGSATPVNILSNTAITDAVVTAVNNHYFAV